MNLGELRAEVRDRTGQESTTFITDAHINGWLNQALRRLYVKLARGSTLTQAWHNIATTAGTRAYAWPAAALTAVGLYYDGVPMEYVSHNRYDNLTGEDINESDEGTPEHWTRREQKIEVYPAPDADGTTTLRLLANNRATAMSVDEDTTGLDAEHDEYPLSHAVYRTLAKLRNWEEAALAREERKEALTDILAVAFPPERKHFDSQLDPQFRAARRRHYLHPV